MGVVQQEGVARQREVARWREVARRREVWHDENAVRRNASSLATPIAHPSLGLLLLRTVLRHHLLVFPLICLATRRGGSTLDGKWWGLVCTTDVARERRRWEAGGEEGIYYRG